MPCGRGFYAPEGSMSCDECPVGFYCPLLVTASPQPCTSGFYANETKSVSCTECDRGKLFIVLFSFVFILQWPLMLLADVYSHVMVFFNMILKTEVMLRKR